MALIRESSAKLSIGLRISGIPLDEASCLHRAARSLKKSDSNDVCMSICLREPPMRNSVARIGRAYRYWNAIFLAKVFRPGRASPRKIRNPELPGDSALAFAADHHRTITPPDYLKSHAKSQLDR